MVDQDGNVCWENIIDKLEKRLDRLQCVWWRNKTLEYKIRMLNAYVLSVMIFPMRSNSSVGEVMDIVRDKVKESLGVKGSRVKYERLLVPRNKGGYGLLDLEEMDIALKRTWIQYIYEKRDLRFNQLINAWSHFTRYNAGTL
jgi:hypothetical protein